jgi:hypothetical protein
VALATPLLLAQGVHEMRNRDEPTRDMRNRSGRIVAHAATYHVLRL